MKIGVCADTHVGRAIPRVIGNLRREAYRRAFSKAIDIFIAEGVDCVVHGGDLFEKRSITPEDSTFVKNELQRLVDGVEARTGRAPSIFVIRGNHDGTSENDALEYISHPLARYLHIIGDSLLHGEEESYTDDQLCVIGIGYSPYIADKFRAVKPLVERGFAVDGRFKILMVHNFIKGFNPLPPGVPDHSVYTIPDFEGVKADLIVAGHSHRRQGPWAHDGWTMLTPGATESVDLSDEDAHGVYIVDDSQTARFVPIKPIHIIRSVEVGTKDTTHPANWFIEEAVREARSFSASLRAKQEQGILRLDLSGMTDDDPDQITRALYPEMRTIQQENPLILHIETDNKVETIIHTIDLPTMGAGLEYATKILEGLGSDQAEGVKMVEEVSDLLDSRASKVTGLLTGTDRAMFVKRWTELLNQTPSSPD